MSIVGGFSLGDTTDELIGWFDAYADKTNNEGQMKKYPFDEDWYGTSVLYDVIYHSITLMMGFMVFTNIAVGAFVFAWIFMWFDDPKECDWEAIDESTW